MHIVKFTHQVCVEERPVTGGWYSRYEGRAIFSDGIERDVCGSCVSPLDETAHITNWAPKNPNTKSLQEVSNAEPS